MGLNGLESCGNRVDDVTRGCQVSGRRDVNINQWNVKTHWVCRNRDIERDIRWDMSLQESCLKKLFKPRFRTGGSYVWLMCLMCQDQGKI